MNTLSTNAQEFRTALLRLQPFMSTDETRYYLNGVCLDYTKERGLRAIATNGHILLEIRPEASGECKTFREILPAQSVATLLTMLPKPDDFCKKPLEISVKKTEKKTGLEFSWDGWRYSTPVIDGTFPNTDVVIPKGKHKTEFGFNISYLMAALQALMDSGAGTKTPSTFPITFLHDEEEGCPYQITAPSCENFRCVLMPLRVQEDAYHQHNAAAREDEDD
jgi:DNA polymerase III sliding clamp (beta) subunit (PCNA family)